MSYLIITFKKPCHNHKLFVLVFEEIGEELDILSLFKILLTYCGQIQFCFSHLFSTLNQFFSLTKS